jgi:ribonuclease Z
MELIFLGTSQAVPTAKRNHTAILLKYKDETILFDCGEGTQRQFRIARINPCKLTRLFISHFHGDHMLGIPGLLQTLALNGYNRTLEIYIPIGTRKYIDLMLNMFAFAGKIKYKVHEIDSKIALETEDFLINALPLEHSTICLAYSFIEKEKIRMDKKKLKKYKLFGPLVGELQKGKNITLNGKKIKPEQVSYKQPGRKLTIIMDTKICSNCIEIAKNSDLLISEATYCSETENKAEEYFHLTGKQAAEIAKKSKSEKLIITHISQRYEKNPECILNEARKVFKKTELAKDFMKVEI